MASLSYNFIWSERRPWIWQRSRTNGLIWTDSLKNPIIIQRKHILAHYFTDTSFFFTLVSCVWLERDPVFFFNMTSLWSRIGAKRLCRLSQRSVGLGFHRTWNRSKARSRANRIHSSQSVRFHCRRNSSISQAAQVWHTLQIRSGSIFSAPILRQL